MILKKFNQRHRQNTFRTNDIKNLLDEIETTLFKHESDNINKQYSEFHLKQSTR